jgi:hypothetical protein
MGLSCFSPRSIVELPRARAATTFVTWDDAGSPAFNFGDFEILAAQTVQILEQQPNTHLWSTAPLLGISADLGLLENVSEAKGDARNIAGDSRSFMPDVDGGR